MPELKLTRTDAGIRVDAVSPETRRALMLAMTAIDPGAQYAPDRPDRQRWDGSVCLYHAIRSGDFFPTGLLRRAIETGETRGDTVTVSEGRWTLGLGHGARRDGYPKTGVTLRQGQVRLVEAALRERRGVWHAVPNSGKTEAAFELIERLHPARTLFLLFNISLLKQTMNRMTAAFYPEPIGLVHQQTQDWQRLTVASIPTLAAILGRARGRQERCNATHRLATYPVVIIDECHLASSASARRVLRAVMGAEYVIGLSGSPWTGHPVRDLRMEAFIGPVIARISASEQIEAGYSAKPCILQIPFTHSHIPGGYDEARRYGIYNNYHRNMLIAGIWRSLRERGHCVFIPTDSLEHIETLRAIINGPGVDVITGADSAGAREAKFEAMRRGDLHTFIATNVLDLGINIPELSAVIEAGAHGSPVQTVQRLGRIQRKKARHYCIYVLPMDVGNRHLHHLYRRRFKELQDEAACEKFISATTLTNLEHELDRLN